MIKSGADFDRKLKIGSISMRRTSISKRGSAMPIGQNVKIVCA